jgi:hypothetical protein
MKELSARAILKRHEDLEKERKEVFKKIATDFWVRVAVQIIERDMEIEKEKKCLKR